MSQLGDSAGAGRLIRAREPKLPHSYEWAMARLVGLWSQSYNVSATFSVILKKASLPRLFHIDMSGQQKC